MSNRLWGALNTFARWAYTLDDRVLAGALAAACVVILAAAAAVVVLAAVLVVSLPAPALIGLGVAGAVGVVWYVFYELVKSVRRMVEEEGRPDA